jgi:hypothetical protein
LLAAEKMSAEEGNKEGGARSVSMLRQWFENVQAAQEKSRRGLEEVIPKKAAADARACAQISEKKARGRGGSSTQQTESASVSAPLCSSFSSSSAAQAKDGDEESEDDDDDDDDKEEKEEKKEKMRKQQKEHVRNHHSSANFLLREQSKRTGLPDHRVAQQGYVNIHFVVPSPVDGEFLSKKEASFFLSHAGGLSPFASCPPLESNAPLYQLVCAAFGLSGPLELLAIPLGHLWIDELEQSRDTVRKSECIASSSSSAAFSASLSGRNCGGARSSSSATTPTAFDDDTRERGIRRSVSSRADVVISFWDPHMPGTDYVLVVKESMPRRTFTTTILPLDADGPSSTLTRLNVAVTQFSVRAKKKALLELDVECHLSREPGIEQGIETLEILLNVSEPWRLCAYEPGPELRSITTTAVREWSIGASVQGGASFPSGGSLTAGVSATYGRSRSIMQELKAYETIPSLSLPTSDERATDERTPLLAWNVNYLADIGQTIEPDGGRLCAIRKTFAAEFDLEEDQAAHNTYDFEISVCATPLKSPDSSIIHFKPVSLVWEPRKLELYAHSFISLRFDKIMFIDLLVPGFEALTESIRWCTDRQHAKPCFCTVQYQLLDLRYALSVSPGAKALSVLLYGDERWSPSQRVPVSSLEGPGALGEIAACFESAFRAEHADMARWLYQVPEFVLLPGCPCRPSDLSKQFLRTCEELFGDFNKLLNITTQRRRSSAAPSVSSGARGEKLEQLFVVYSLFVFTLAQLVSPKAGIGIAAINNRMTYMSPFWSSWIVESASADESTSYRLYSLSTSCAGDGLTLEQLRGNHLHGKLASTVFLEMLSAEPATGSRMSEQDERRGGSRVEKKRNPSDRLRNYEMAMRKQWESRETTTGRKEKRKSLYEEADADRDWNRMRWDELTDSFARFPPAPKLPLSTNASLQTVDWGQELFRKLRAEFLKGLVGQSLEIGNFRAPASPIGASSDDPPCGAHRPIGPATFAKQSPTHRKWQRREFLVQQNGLSGHVEVVWRAAPTSGFGRMKHLTAFRNRGNKRFQVRHCHRVRKTSSGRGGFSHGFEICMKPDEFLLDSGERKPCGRTYRLRAQRKDKRDEWVKWLMHETSHCRCSRQGAKAGSSAVVGVIEPERAASSSSARK